MTKSCPKPVKWHILSYTVQSGTERVPLLNCLCSCNCPSSRNKLLGLLSFVSVFISLVANNSFPTERAQGLRSPGAHLQRRRQVAEDGPRHHRGSGKASGGGRASAADQHRTRWEAGKRVARFCETQARVLENEGLNFWPSFCQTLERIVEHWIVGPCPVIPRQPSSK